MNPSTSHAVSGNQTGTSPQGGLNNPRTANRESYNTFNRSRKRLSTQLFDKVQPMYCQYQIEGDVSRLRVSHDLRTYTLKSPLLSDVQMHRTFFQVPWSAIMPRTWEYLYRQPVKGDDITYRNVAPVVSLYDFIHGSLPSLNASGFTTLEDGRSAIPVSMFYVANSGNTFTVFIRQALWLKLIFSRNSLLKNLGVSIPYEDLGDNVFSYVVNALMYLSQHLSEVSTGNVSISYLDLAGNVINYRLTKDTTLSTLYNHLDRASDYINSFQIRISGYSASDEKIPIDSDGSFMAIFNDSSVEYIKCAKLTKWYNFKLSGIYSDTEQVLNLMPLIAYQMCMAQFYSNPNIDEVSTAKDWLERCDTAFRGNLVSSEYAINTFNYFTLNGVKHPLDTFAGVRLTYFYREVIASYFSIDHDTTDSSYLKQLGVVKVFNSLFSPARSMRRGDYFVNARTQPLAVGDVDITVSSSKVSAIDVNKSLWVQKFLNAVNRASQNIYEYIQSIAGVTPERIAPQPNFVCDESYHIGNYEVENTSSDNQGNVVTLLRNQESRYMYEVFIDEPSIIIGVNSFNMDFAYPESSDKTWFIKDRMEYFNSFMQHVGDQALNVRELKVPLLETEINSTFGYQLRYAEFKNSISQATGGFCADDTQLDSWAAIMDTRDDLVSEVQSSEFIRNRNDDFDKFYASLTGTNPTNRFHFIIAQNIDNMVNSKQEAYPSLL